MTTNNDRLAIRMTDKQLELMAEYTVDGHAWGPGQRPTLTAARWIGPAWAVEAAIESIRYDLNGYAQDDGGWHLPGTRERRTMLTLIRKLERVLSTTTEDSARRCPL
jgi:hypothetical protein